MDPSMSIARLARLDVQAERAEHLKLLLAWLCTRLDVQAKHGKLTTASNAN